MAGLGDCFAFVAVVPLIQLFLDTYGWRGTMLLLGVLVLHLAVCGALMKPLATSGSQVGYDYYYYYLFDQYKQSSYNNSTRQNINGKTIIKKQEIRKINT